MSLKNPRNIMPALTLLFATIAALVVCGLWVGAIRPVTPGCIQPAQPMVVAPRITVIHFTAPWCGPCQQQRPEYERIRQKHNRCEFQTADADSDGDVFKENHVSRIPTYIVFDGEAEVYRTTSADDLGHWLDQDAASAEPDQRSQYEKDHHLRPGEQPANSSISGTPSINLR